MKKTKKTSDTFNIEGKVKVNFATKEVELKAAPLDAYMAIREHKDMSKLDLSGLWGEYIADNFVYTSKLGNGWKIKQFKGKR